MTTQGTSIQYDADRQRLLCQGEWDLTSFSKLKASADHISWPQEGELVIDGHAIKKMDSSGACLLSMWAKDLSKKGITVRFESFQPAYQTLLKLVEKGIKKETSLPKEKPVPFMKGVGKIAIEQLKELTLYLSFIGQLTIEVLYLFPKMNRWRWQSLAGVIYKTGYLALPIIALLSYMIGVVITYQMGLQLRNYGANVYIVDLLGLSILREFGPLLTAIMIAGRTGSAFTAQLGL